MTRFWFYLLPHPILSVTILMVWLILNQSLGLGSFILGVILALTGGRAYALLDPPQARFHKPITILRLFGRVLGDIAYSNYEVGKTILHGVLSRKERKQSRSGFLVIPLGLKNKNALAVLAIIIASTPGTLWINYVPGTGVLTIHVLNLIDEKAWIDTIKMRYEKPLMEIFEHG